MQLSYYLFDKSVKTFSNVWKDGDPPSPPTGYQKISLKKPFSDWAAAYLHENHTSKPPWVDFVRPCCVAGVLDGVENASSSFVLLLNVQKRIFAICFGHGYTAIDHDLLEPDFGLWVAANSIARNKVVAIHARNVDPVTVSKHFVVNRDSELFVFDVDFLLNILTSLEGRPEDPKFGSRVRGRDACYLTAKVDVGMLKQECIKLLKTFRVTRKDDAFQMLRDVRYVKGKAVQQQLDQLLADALRQGQDASLGLVLPDIAEYEQIAQYTFGTPGRRIELKELLTADVLSWIQQHSPARGNLLGLRFEAVSHDGTPLQRFALKQAVVFQTVHQGDTYVHTLGRWYRVAADFVARINAQVGQIEVIPKGSWLPDIHEQGKDAEGRYNTRVADRKTRALLDKKNVQIAGESQIEVADLFSSASEFIHVKRHTRSSTLSHLFAQGTVSGRLFRDHTEFREKMRTKLPTKMRRLINPKSNSVSGFTVVYAITAPRSRNLPKGLPFFSKVNLLHHVRELERMGYHVKLYHIQET